MKNQRAQIMIKNDFQHRLILSTLLTTLISLNVILLIAGLLDVAIGHKFLLVDVFRTSVAVMEFVAIGVVYLVSRKISFHIAGPVYAIERTLRQMHEGKLFQRLTLRKGDQFTEVADVINELLDNYQGRLLNLKAILDSGQELTPAQRQQLSAELAFFITERPKQATLAG